MVIFAFQTSYLPLGQGELKTRVNLISVKNDDDTWLEETIRIPSAGVNGVVIHPQDSENDATIIIEGKDQKGDPWTFFTEYAGQGFSVWRADLDNDGREDIVLLGYTGGVGLAPTMHMTVLLFDKQGRPVPWSIEGYFGKDEHGIEDLLDLNRDKRAEIVRMAYDEGYWITSLYEARSGYWHQIHSKHGKSSFPLYTRFTNRANRKATKPEQKRAPLEDKLGSSGISKSVQLNITSLQRWIENYEDAIFLLSDGRTCRLAYWYSTAAVVIDRPHRRDSALLEASKEARKLVEEIIQRKLPVKITGWRRLNYINNRKDACVPELIWAVDHN